MKKRITLFFLTFTLSQNIFSQTIKSNNKDSLILLFINSKEVLDGFKHCHKPDTGILIFLDPDSLLTNINVSSWWRHSIIVITKGELIDSIKRFDANYVIKNRNNYFVLRERKSVGEDYLLIHFPYNNLFTQAIIKKIKKTYVISNIKSGVM